MKPSIEPGQRFGYLTTTGNSAKFGKERHYRWEFKCDCGNIKLITIDGIRRGKVKSCGCKHGPGQQPENIRKREEDIGKKFHRLTILGDYYLNKGKNSTYFVKVRCECGKEFMANYQSVKRSHIKSCGCWQKDKAESHMKKREEYIGKKIGKLYIIGDFRLEEVTYGKKIKKKWMVKVKCDCGTEKYIEYQCILNGQQTCGCIHFAGKFNQKSKYLSTAFYSRMRGNAKSRNIPLEIDLSDIDELYEKQNGKCYYTGRDLVLDLRSNEDNIISVDRIDSSKSYTKDNIVLCTGMSNVSKMDNEAESWIRMCNDVARTHPRPI